MLRPLAILAFASAAALACGSTDASAPVAGDASADGDVAALGLPDVAPEKPLCTQPQVTYVVEVPAPGVAADPALVCGATPPVTSTGAARVALSDYLPLAETAKGFVAVPPAVLANVVGLPKVAVASATPLSASEMVVANVALAAGGFRFDASFPHAIVHGDLDNTQITLEVTLTIACGDGGTVQVTSATNVATCITRSLWASSGESCTYCVHPPKA